MKSIVNILQPGQPIRDFVEECAAVAWKEGQPVIMRAGGWSGCIAQDAGSLDITEFVDIVSAAVSEEKP